MRGQARYPMLLEQGEKYIVDKQIDMRILTQGYAYAQVEIGCGRGTFLIQMAKNHPDVFFIGVDLVAFVIAQAAALAATLALDNICFICTDIDDVSLAWTTHHFDVVYLNFCDPWPRPRHHRRRLTHASKLSFHAQLLKESGHLEFKTDNRDLFSWSKQSLTRAAWRLQEVNDDVQNIPPEGLETTGIYTQTAYEQRFRQKGIAIAYLRALPPIELPTQ